MTPHFTLGEFLRSDTATRLGIRNEPSAEHHANLMMLATKLEEVRALLGAPMVITSGYRSPELNRAVDGSKTSSHSHGLAADFHAYKFGTDMEVCIAIMGSGIKYDQLIFEQTTRSTWVHLGIGDRMRQETLSWKSGQGYVYGVKKI